MRKLIASAALAVLCPFAAPAADLPPWAQPVAKVPRKALVLGVGAYDHLNKLTTPAFDADKVAATLGSPALGFQVTHPAGPMDRRSMLSAITAYLDTVEPGDLAVIYYSGHGIERDGINYLIPSDVPSSLTPGREGHQAISLDWLMDALKLREPALTIFILDACRENPFPAVPGAPNPVGQKGLAAPSDADTGIFVGFAAAPRAVSYSRLDGDPADSPSIFTRQLIGRLFDQGQSVYGLWNVVGHKVYDMTAHKQQPWHNASLFPELKLLPRPGDTAEEDNAWANAVLGSTPAALRADLSAFLDIYPVSDHAPAARKKIAEIDAAGTAPADPALEGLTQRVALMQLAGRPVVAGDKTLVGSLSNWVTAAWSRRIQDVGGLLAFSTIDQKVYAAANASSRSVASIAVGAPVAVIDPPSSGRFWSKVVLPTGQIGFIDGADLFQPHAEQVVDLAFDPGATIPRDDNWARTTVAALAGKTGRVTISIGSAEAPLADRALSLVYLRGLALRGELVRNGVARDRIDVSFSPDPRLSHDAAKLRIRTL